MGEQLQRILVCDDDPEIRRILVIALRQKAFLHIDEAGEGRSAIDMIRENRYAVVLLDLMMPGVDGFAVLESLRQDPQPPIVLVVSGAGRQVLDRLDTSRIHGVVKKPFDPIELAEVVAACAEIRGRSAFETMAVATMVAGAPLIALLRL